MSKNFQYIYHLDISEIIYHSLIQSKFYGILLWGIALNGLLKSQKSYSQDDM